LPNRLRAVRGRHSARAWRVPAGAVLAVLGACLITAVVVVAGTELRGAGAKPPAPGGTAAATHAALPRPQKAASPASTPARSADPLGGTAASYVSTRAGTVLAAVYDVGTGQTWYLGHGQPQAEASVVKLDILETLLARQGQSTPAGLPAGDQSLAQQMIEESDNDAATSLWNAVGGATGIRSFNTAAGLTATSPSPCVVCAGFPWPGWGLTTSTPADQLALLRELVEPSRLLTNAERHYALALMENVTPSQRWGVSGGVPAQITVALKNGWLPLNEADTDWQINSVGWVSGRGRDYLIAVLSTGNPDEQYGIDTIDQLAAIVWRHMR
jgi:Beta-lactamase enzyme family